MRQNLINAAFRVNTVFNRDLPLLHWSYGDRDGVLNFDQARELGIALIKAGAIADSELAIASSFAPDVSQQTDEALGSARIVIKQLCNRRPSLPEGISPQIGEDLRAFVQVALIQTSLTSKEAHELGLSLIEHAERTVAENFISTTITSQFQTLSEGAIASFQAYRSRCINQSHGLNTKIS